MKRFILVVGLVAAMIELIMTIPTISFEQRGRGETERMSEEE